MSQNKKATDNIVCNGKRTDDTDIDTGLTDVIRHAVCSHFPNMNAPVSLLETNSFISMSTSITLRTSYDERGRLQAS